jgi:small subunit ribosomal protein S1
MTWSHEIKHPSKLVSVGDQVEAQVLNVERKGRKISLGMKQVATNPWEVVEAKYAVGSMIEGKVKSLTEFGVFVGLEEGIDGLIHVSDLSWTKRMMHPADLFKKGQTVKAVVLRVDKEKERLSLGYKQLSPDPWEQDIPTRYQVGQDVKGKVVKTTDFGAFVECEDGVEGLLHASEMTLEPGQKVEDAYKVGDEVTARVIRVDSAERKIALSIREHVGDYGLPEGDERRPQKRR